MQIFIFFICMRGCQPYTLYANILLHGIHFLVKQKEVRTILRLFGFDSSGNSVV